MSEAKAPFHAGEKLPALEMVFTWLYHFSDGSRITIIVDTPRLVALKV